MRGRKTPYLEKGIGRVPCVRCGRPSVHQWQICSDDRLYRPVCERCDLALNVLVLKWMGFSDWKEKIAKYKGGES